MVSYDNLFAILTDAFFIPFKNDLEPGAVAHTCDPSYSGGRDQED
jgi:hypothetical protein